MKLRNVALLALLFYSQIITAQNNFSIKSTNIKIAGTSTLHDWIVLCSKATGTGLFTLESNKLKDIKSLQIIVPVKELKSESGSNKMDKKIYETLKVTTAPDIKFKLTRIVSMPTENNGNSLTAIGSFTIAGISREETLKVLAKVADNNLISFTGSIKIKMTDYNIKPPTAMMGMMNTGNEVELKFNCSMQKNN
jgi:polyisoprenoid-binding protein YceI